DLSGMSFSTTPLIGKVVWNDLITEDIDAARRFYGELFGWSFEEATGPGRRGYALARSGDVYVAGFVPVDAPADGGKLSRWLPYLSVADVDRAVTSGVDAGARVAVAARNVSLGRVAAMIDPEGAVIGVARSSVGDPDDKTTAAAPGRVVWTELLSNDSGVAAAFYRSMVGYEVRNVERRGGTYTLLGNGGADRAGILKNPTDDWDPVWLTYFGVPIGSHGYMSVGGTRWH
ncbi:MAG TPA: VOC family protein, partial [Woeseiaceae bacterium]